MRKPGHATARDLRLAKELLEAAARNMRSKLEQAESDGRAVTLTNLEARACMSIVRAWAGRPR